MQLFLRRVVEGRVYVEEVPLDGVIRILIESEDGAVYQIGKSPREAGFGISLSVEGQILVRPTSSNSILVREEV